MAGTTSGHAMPRPARSRWRRRGSGRRRGGSSAFCRVSISKEPRAFTPTARGSLGELRLGTRRDGSRRPRERSKGAFGPGRPDWCCSPTETPDSPDEWQDRQDYGENVTGDLLGNAIASGAPAAEIRHRFLTARGLVREEGERRTGLIRGVGGHPLSPAGVCGRRFAARSLISSVSPRPWASRQWRVGRRDRSGPRRPPGRPGRWRSWVTPERRTACCGSSGGQRRRTGRCPNGWRDRWSSRHRPRRSPGRTPSQSWRSGRAIPSDQAQGGRVGRLSHSSPPARA